MLELDVHPHPELLDVERRGAPVDADLLADPAGLVWAETLFNAKAQSLPRTCRKTGSAARADADEAALGDDSIEMSLIATARSVPGTLRQDVLIDGRHHITTDEPERLGGEGCGPAPHELLPAALAACISATLVAYGNTKDWELGEITVDVVYDNKSVPRHFDVSVRVAGNIDDDSWSDSGRSPPPVPCAVRSKRDSNSRARRGRTTAAPTHA